MAASIFLFMKGKSDVILILLIAVIVLFDAGAYRMAETRTSDIIFLSIT